MSLAISKQIVVNAKDDFRVAVTPRGAYKAYYIPLSTCRRS
jgi:hypothetical protein